MTDVEVTGAQEVINNLTKVASAGVKGMEEGLKQSMVLVEGTAKRLAPVDTGRLRSSIRSEIVNKNSAKIFTQVDYAVYQELGTKLISGTPFLRPALRRNVMKINRIFTGIVGRKVRGSVSTL